MTIQVREALEALRDAEGLLHITTVVEAAADPASPLHPHFEWDDTAAAQRYRLTQARTLIRSQKIQVKIGPAIVRSVEYIPSAVTIGAYRRLTEIEPGSDDARAVMLRELGRVGGMLGRTRNIAAILDLHHEVDDLLHALSVLRSRAETATPAPVAA
jgi:hypothetical protein